MGSFEEPIEEGTGMFAVFAILSPNFFKGGLSHGYAYFRLLIGHATAVFV